jgi:hypothetical protein
VGGKIMLNHLYLQRSWKRRRKTEGIEILAQESNVKGM